MEPVDQVRVEVVRTCLMMILDQGKKRKKGGKGAKHKVEDTVDKEKELEGIQVLRAGGEWIPFLIEVNDLAEAVRMRGLDCLGQACSHPIHWYLSTRYGPSPSSNDKRKPHPSSLDT